MTNTFEVGSDKFAIYFAHGWVAGMHKNFETRVSGGGGGGATYQGTGGTAPVHISSTTYIHDKIFLDHRNGQQTAIELTDWDIAAMQGHELLVIWIIKNNNERGPYVTIKNYTTGQLYWVNPSIDALAGKPFFSKLFNQNGCNAIIFAIILCGIISYIAYVMIPAFTTPGFFMGGIALIVWTILNNIKYKARKAAIRQNIDEFLKNYRR